MNYKDKLAEAQKLFDQAKAILTNPEATAEEKNQVEPLMEDAKKLKAEAGQLKELEAFAETMETEVKTKAASEPDTEKQARKDKSQFLNWEEYIVSVYNALNPRYKGPRDPRLQWFKEERKPGHEQKDMAESVGASGGFLVPAEFQATLLSVMGESSIVRPRATTIRMNRRALQIPVLDQTGTTADQPHWFGGMQFYWTEEAEEKDESDPSFRQIQLVAHKLIGYTRASDELLDDSAISLSDFLSGPMGMSGGIAWEEDWAFLRGSGAGQPLGVIPAGATITVARAAANSIAFSDLADMMENFLPSGRGVWVITQSAMSDLIQLNGPTGNPSYIWQPNARDGIPGSILGFPVIWSEKVPRIGTTGDVVLADFRYYLLGDRQATTIETTQYDRWRYDQTSWRAVHRVDGQPWLSAPLTYDDGTTQVSPFVILGGTVAT